MTDCGMCNTALNDAMKCESCGREWYWLESGGEQYLTSKPRRVKIVAPLTPGSKIDDCIEPIRADNSTPI